MYSDAQLAKYMALLKNVSLLSKLFSESTTPFLHYRTTEYLYCKVFNAKNLSRSDIAVDAQKGNIGIGIKTFIYSGKSSQEKIAEFNDALDNYRNAEPLDMVREVGRLRNERIEFIERYFDIKSSIYHCIGRTLDKVFVFEEPMLKIDLSKIKLLDAKRSENVINFTDGFSVYAFNISKSTLYKTFVATELNTILEVRVDMLADPLDSIKVLFPEVVSPTKRLVLPLYSTKSGKPYVYESSGLNRWRASGLKRKRRYGEAEIGIRADFMKLAHSLLPPPKIPFNVTLPNGETMMLSVAQQNGKAIMSNPETALGLWIMGEVLDLPENMPVTYEQLLEIGIDSVELTEDSGGWKMNFCEVGSFERYMEQLAKKHL